MRVWIVNVKNVLSVKAAMRLENIMASMGKKDVPIVNVVLKTDVRGTLEALHVALADLATDEVKVRVIGSGVGAITESDVTLAESSEAVLLGFNVRADNTARQKADARWHRHSLLLNHLSID